MGKIFCHKNIPVLKYVNNEKLKNLRANEVLLLFQDRSWRESYEANRFNHTGIACLQNTKFIHHFVIIYNGFQGIGAFQFYH